MVAYFVVALMMMIYKNQFRSLLVTIWLLPGSLASGDQQDHSDLVVDGMIVALVDENRIPARETGMIAELTVDEGDSVTAAQLLGKLDDRSAAIEAAAAETQWNIAAERSGNDRTGDLAKKKLDEAKQSAQEHRLLVEIAERKATNETRILASKKTEAVAKNELDRATRARKRFADSVSQSEIDGLRLAFDRTGLETDQAEFERQNDRLQAQAEQAAALGHRLRIERSSIEVEQAMAEKRVRQLEVELYKQQYELAELATDRHEFRAPFDGVVAEVLHRKGDWVKAGDPVIRVIGLKRLSAEGFVPAAKVKLLRNRSDVNLEIRTSDGKTIKRTGQIDFISPEIDPVNNEVSFRVLFENSDQVVLPGMRLLMRIGS
jgi:multidrug efflux pump subunit AcrA (membrane-fusion protein)